MTARAAQPRHRALVAALVAGLASGAGSAHAQTVADVIADMGPCESHLVRGLSDQLLRAQVCAYPDSLVAFSHPNIHAASSVNQYGSPEMTAALLSVAAGNRIDLNDAFRTGSGRSGGTGAAWLLLVLGVLSWRRRSHGHRRQDPS